MTEKRITAAEVAREVAALNLRVAAVEKAAAEVKATAKETHDKVSELYDALMVPEPGQEHGLLYRQARQTSAVEAGEIVAGWAVKIAGLLAAIGVIAASIKVGIWPEGK